MICVRFTIFYRVKLHELADVAYTSYRVAALHYFTYLTIGFLFLCPTRYCVYIKITKIYFKIHYQTDNEENLFIHNSNILLY